MSRNYFQFQAFTVRQEHCAMKVGTDGTLLGAWARLPNPSGRVLDIGTGTGLIALMMAQRYPQATIVGIDVDANAVGEARTNVALSPFAERIDIRHTSAQQFQSAPFDAIVCNPPFYVDALESPDAGRTQARHASSLPFRDLFAAAFRLLAPDGEFSLICPTESLTQMEQEASLAGLMCSRHCAVKTVERKPPRRHLLAYSRHPSATQQEVQCLDNGRGQRSEWYAALTEKFYLH